MRTGGILISGNPHMFILSYQESTPTQITYLLNDCDNSKHTWWLPALQVGSDAAMFWLTTQATLQVSTLWSLHHCFGCFAWSSQREKNKKRWWNWNYPSHGTFANPEVDSTNFESTWHFDASNNIKACCKRPPRSQELIARKYVMISSGTRFSQAGPLMNVDLSNERGMNF